MADAPRHASARLVGLPEPLARRRQVQDAAKIAAIDASSAASNSSSLIRAVSPSVSAREKLATTPGFRASRSTASSRL